MRQESGAKVGVEVTATLKKLVISPTPPPAMSPKVETTTARGSMVLADKGTAVIKAESTPKAVKNDLGVIRRNPASNSHPKYRTALHGVSVINYGKGRALPSRLCRRIWSPSPPCLDHRPVQSHPQGAFVPANTYSRYFCFSSQRGAAPLSLRPFRWTSWMKRAQSFDLYPAAQNSALASNSLGYARKSMS